MVNFHLSKRPRPKQSINNGNYNNHHINNNIYNGNKPKENLGVVGDPTTLVRLYCELCNYGKTIVRQGYRQGLDATKPSIWVFCPLLRNQFPRDRILVEDCKKCSHFKGVSQNPNITHHVSDFKINYIPARKKPKKLGFSKEEIELAKKEIRRRNKEWKKEEKEIFDKE